MASNLKLCAISLWAMLSLPVALADAAPASPEPSAALYDALVVKLQSGDTNIDYTALRLSYPLTNHYDPYRSTSRPLFEAAWKALKAKDCNQVFTRTDELLRVNFIDVDAHAFRASCYEDAGDTASEARETAIGRGILASLFASGDGKTFETAYQVVTLNEEGLVMARFNAREESQALLSHDGHSYDQLTGTNAKSGETVQLLFGIDPVFGHWTRIFGEPTSR